MANARPERFISSGDTEFTDEWELNSKDPYRGNPAVKRKAAALNTSSEAVQSFAETLQEYLARRR